jgi:hypothetical protein
MKTVFALMLLCLLLVGLTFPPPTHAVFWVDELMSCTNAYVESADQINFLRDTSQITEQEWRDLHDFIGDNYTGCLSIVQPTIEPDFCAAAQSAEAHCDAQFGGYGLESFDEYMQCRAKSGIDSCQ